MFLNTQALRAHLDSAPESPQQQLLALPMYRNHRPELSAIDHAQLFRRLHAGWGTEYALRATLEITDENYLRDATDWTLKQAYFAIFSTMNAFLYTFGLHSTNRALTTREVGRMVVKNAYPRPASFYAAGSHGDVTVHRLPLSAYKYLGPGLGAVEAKAQAEVDGQLRMCRKLKAHAVRAEVQANANTAIRKPDGQLLTHWKAADWQQITWRLGYTTIFDLLAHLYDGDASAIFPTLAARSGPRVAAFHHDLLFIINWLNGVHEAYLAKSVGVLAYSDIVRQLPVHLRDSFVSERFTAWMTANSIQESNPPL